MKKNTGTLFSKAPKVFSGLNSKNRFLLSLADQQVELIIKNVYIAECNHVFARMYEELPENIIGCNVSMLKYQNPEGNARILKFIMNDYKVIEDEVSEFSADGHEKNFIVNIWHNRRRVFNKCVAFSTIFPKRRKLKKP